LACPPLGAAPLVLCWVCDTAGTARFLVRMSAPFAGGRRHRWYRPLPFWGTCGQCVGTS
jgi:hypothetical protein